MSERFRYESTVTPIEMATAIDAASQVAIFTHARPDGDAVGAAAAIARRIRRRGGNATIWLAGGMAGAIERFARRAGYRDLAHGAPAPDDFRCAVVVDTGAWSQVAEAGALLRGREESTLIIDHHAHGDPVGTRRLVDIDCASTTQVILHMGDVAGWDLDRESAEAIFLGLATDTGWFRFANAGVRVYADAARLLALGVDKARLYREVEETHPIERLRLEAKALASLRLELGGRLAIQCLSGADFDDAAGGSEMLAGVVNHPLVAEPVQVAALLVERQPSVVKVSLRSKIAADGGPALDVNAVAGRLGGGGHRQAAGVTLHMGLEAAAQAICAAVAEEIEAPSAP
ncbi:MAG: DHH family phosphoesterase [Phycisphaeraceae bacterium]|nr:DHH family phosphoesterase [Phycisphaeraceae bacterium]